MVLDALLDSVEGTGDKVAPALCAAVDPRDGRDQQAQGQVLLRRTSRQNRREVPPSKGRPYARREREGLRPGQRRRQPQRERRGRGHLQDEHARRHRGLRRRRLPERQRPRLPAPPAAVGEGAWEVALLRRLLPRLHGCGHEPAAPGHLLQSPGIALGRVARLGLSEHHRGEAALSPRLHDRCVREVLAADPGVGPVRVLPAPRDPGPPALHAPAGRGR
mmetsp:Transcript_96549/g.288183  ORF Transcript_96549/g.288183 Transcript_96549/m.288183 type:complete len:219 (-) Transcript_96549:517-1173(-)